jgi:hypothetical protein
MLTLSALAEEAVSLAAMGADADADRERMQRAALFYDGAYRAGLGGSDPCKIAARLRQYRKRVAAAYNLTSPRAS